MPVRVRIYIGRISGGKPAGSSGTAGCLSGASSDFDDAVSLSADFGLSAGTGCINFGKVSFTIGAPWRIVITVVAIYSGNDASINMPNTNPGKPRSSARARICHWVPENILKLNSQYKIAHIIKT